jgi:hypothetical protein
MVDTVTLAGFGTDDSEGRAPLVLGELLGGEPLPEQDPGFGFRVEAISARMETHVSHSQGCTRAEQATTRRRQISRCSAPTVIAMGSADDGGGCIPPPTSRGMNSTSVANLVPQTSNSVVVSHDDKQHVKTTSELLVLSRGPTCEYRRHLF